MFAWFSTHREYCRFSLQILKIENWLNYHRHALHRNPPLLSQCQEQLQQYSVGSSWSVVGIADNLCKYPEVMHFPAIDFFQPSLITCEKVYQIRQTPSVGSMLACLRRTQFLVRYDVFYGAAAIEGFFAKQTCPGQVRNIYLRILPQT